MKTEENEAAWWNRSDPMERFRAALRQVVLIPKSEMNKMLAKDRAMRESAYAAGKPKRGRKPKRPAL